MEQKMDYSEKWGKDVDEAVRLALEDLNLTEDQVMVTVLEEPAKGFLGLGSKLAKVRVEKVALIEEPETTFSSEENVSKKANRDLRKKNRAQEQGTPARERHNAGEDTRKSGNENRGDGKERREYKDTFPEIDFTNKPLLSERPADLKEIEDNETSLFLKSIIGNMKLDVVIKTFENDECMYFEIEGNDANAVIGKRGQTLDSIQYLTNLVTNKDRQEYKRVTIDVEGYRSRREKTLERLAAKLAKKVLRTGRNEKLEPMNPYERKVIHATLQNIEQISTRSEGEEPYRRIIIEKVK
jgi:spoIIIJ-associated protein